jgi:ubiquinol-cytochrome c reductase cytochrome b subunit
LWGGFAVDSPTLTRFYALHYLFPFLILGLVILHIWALHIPGNNNPVGIDVKKPSKDTVPFHPYIVIKDLYALLIFLILFAFFVFFFFFFFFSIFDSYIYFQHISIQKQMIC